MPKPDASGALYRYRGPDGGWVYTNTPTGVPEAHRDSMETFVPEAKLERVEETAKHAASRVKAEAEQALEGLPAKAKALGSRGKREAKTIQREVGDVVPFVKDLDLPSVAIGFAGAVVMWVASAVLRRSGRLLFKVAGVALVVVLIAGAYFGWLRRAAGLSDGRLASPAAIVDDAKKAANDMQNRLQQNERVLRRLEETSP